MEKVYKNVEKLPIGSYAWLDMIFSISCFQMYANFQKEYWCSPVVYNNKKLYKIARIPNNYSFENEYYTLLDTIMVNPKKLKEKVKELSWVLN